MADNEINLPPPKRYITTNDPKTGKAVFSKAMPVEAEGSDLLNAKLYNLYTTSTFPVELADDADIEAYKPNYPEMASFHDPNGVLLRIIDCPPNLSKFPHRTETVDFGVVIQGQIELVLDDGVSQVLNQGDVFVQRATVHEWHNPSETEPARFLAVLLPAKPPIGPDGKPIGPLFGSWE
ncbi:putative cupin domain-containing protein [Phaeoacremonium minimum UCRPA7]|uniref:Putative cupin domain-containing protein n=1 Tax=Phaeoacremonium minimum (strain UCR-PA7) TaxID=1286976 RepID=R8BD87_PHAM7|nr:putative cupin domain-containing protein [Phaeoacremonium minimum UCRPA7]EON97268.1 putative cupin domain-containing protein [Phaeoacremonium minimum UCRPA7]